MCEKKTYTCFLKEEKEERKKMNTAEKVDKLRKLYPDLDFSASLPRKLTEAGNRLAGRSNPSLECLISIVDGANFWKKYIDEKDFIKFIECMMISMYEINTSVISTHEDLRSYIGNYAKVTEELPDCTTMVVSFSGRVQIGGRGGTLDTYLPEPKNSAWM